DVLTEVVNIAIGRSAALLSEMTGRKVELSVPYMGTIRDVPLLS
ncbi:MAG: CheC-like family, partial [Firmicutes bacterium]|nr:CheC-like family [Bacillota bacterium]